MCGYNYLLRFRYNYTGYSLPHLLAVDYNTLLPFAGYIVTFTLPSRLNLVLRNTDDRVRLYRLPYIPQRSRAWIAFTLLLPVVVSCWVVVVVVLIWIVVVTTRFGSPSPVVAFNVATFDIYRYAVCYYYLPCAFGPDLPLPHTYFTFTLTVPLWVIYVPVVPVGWFLVVYTFISSPRIQPFPLFGILPHSLNIDVVIAVRLPCYPTVTVVILLQFILDLFAPDMLT